MIARWAILILMLASTASLRAGEVLDRIIATVDGRSILQSDVENELRYECFMAGRTFSGSDSEERTGAFNRLIDQQLLEEQIHSAEFKTADPEEIDRQFAQLKADYGREHEQKSWDSALLDYGITEQTVKEHVAHEINELRLVDARLRPTIQIDSADIEAYYRQQVLPKLASGQTLRLPEAAARIRELLVQQKMNQELDSWLRSLRAQARVHVLAPEFAGAQNGDR